MAECQAAIDAIPVRYEKYRSAIMLAAWGQLRRGEVLALQRRDIDIELGTVRVERAWLITEDGRTTLGDPKTKAGDRTVHVPTNVLDALKVHLVAHVDPPSNSWLFPGADGEPMHPRTFARAWTKAREAIGRPDLRFHDLRHSGLTWVAQAGATQAELMRRGGHDSPAAAIRYQHAADERDRALADALSRMSEQVDQVVAAS
jgi:integrase